ncbi:mechanosensitive ion channel family protein [Synoicihabitans lomoniglobus]|uniref:Mechanosensing system component YbdG n=1 Tax=Synoicihabitans lomoniglobus TaxID=2909285 RepID=A0AAF0CPM9_9BACT|nr:mechanosensitive ion channel family protein [Opitutaceae bacterium LMO-M01]WED65584.1 mechanosensitive ion channel [Opitutaceae bacterium LMO-M01]
MNPAITQLKDFLLSHHVDELYAQAIATGAGVIGLFVLAWAVNYIAKHIILRAVNAVVRRTKFQWDDVLLDTGVFTRLSHLAPALVINTFGASVLGDSPRVLAGVSGAVSLYLICIWLGVLFAILNAVHIVSQQKGAKKGVPVKGFIQAIKLVSVVVSLIFMLAILLNKSPVYLFSGLGALTAVLLFVFKDAILGFVAGIQISANNMVTVGDWIEMPSAGADGDVIDVSLTTVKVQNWDKTITTIPTYSLISDSFRNWKGMSESGGRRIKRSIHFDISSIRFADEEQLERWSKIGHVREHLERKKTEIAKDNEKLGEAANVLGNGRRLTNIGTFRAYCLIYLKTHKDIDQEKTLLVRQLEPTEHGLPLQIYTFVNNTAWAYYEGVQSDIFDHLLSVAKVFDLRVFQEPSGSDIVTGIAALKSTAAKES